MGFLDVLGGIGSALSPFVSAGTSMLNMYREDYWNKRQEDMTRESWQREDTAVQRRAADLKAAGLNPAMAASSAASSSGAANFTSSNQMQTSFDEWIKSPLNREAYKQAKWETTAAKYNAMGIMNQAYDLANYNYWNNGFSMLFGARGQPVQNNNSDVLDYLSNQHKNNINTQYLQSLYNLDQTKYILNHQDFTNTMNLLSASLNPMLDVLDVASRLNHSFTYKRR